PAGECGQPPDRTISDLANRRVGKGALAPCPPSLCSVTRNGGHAPLSPTLHTVGWVEPNGRCEAPPVGRNPSTTLPGEMVGFASLYPPYTVLIPKSPHGPADRSGGSCAARTQGRTAPSSACGSAPAGGAAGPRTQDARHRHRR